MPLKWQKDLGRSTYDRPVYQDGLVFFPANSIFSSAWYSLEAASGRTLWSQPIKRGSYYRCLTSGYLVVSGPRSLITLKANTGEIIWEGHRAQTASCSETMVFVVVPRSFVMAYDLATGQSVWQGINPRHDVGGLIYNLEEEKLIAGGAV
ncbi:MAG: PQQ-binding-like beta-propeller repeat protein, partial [Ketobacter sp.]|nr:PQQ-binding-like beta-propeller repeat protein [Ketobacter sp.]